MVKPLMRKATKPMEVCPFCSNKVNGYVAHPFGSVCPIIKELQEKVKAFPPDAQLDFTPIFNADKTKITGIAVEYKKGCEPNGKEKATGQAVDVHATKPVSGNAQVGEKAD